MRRLMTLLLTGLGLSLSIPSLEAKDAPAKPAKAETASCGGDYGTEVHFEKTPSHAAKRALKEEKLVLVLHISGLFEEPDFT